MKLCRICLKNATDICSVTASSRIFFEKILQIADIPGELIVCIWCNQLIQHSVKLYEAAIDAHNFFKHTNLHGDGIDVLLKAKRGQIKLHNLSRNKIENVNIIDKGDFFEDDFRELSDKVTIKEENEGIFLNDEVSDTYQNAGNERKRRGKSSKFKVIYLTYEEQVKEIEDKRQSENYMKFKFRCEPCGAAFLTEDVLKIHMERHSDVSGPYACRICTLRFSKSEVLSQHHLAHRRHFQCDVCQVIVKRPWDCMLHRSKCDSGENSAVCVYCRKIFRDEYTLKIHVKGVHLKEKKYTCEQCSRWFVQKQKLTAHLRTHTGEKPFSCAQCHRTFASNSNLTVHIRTVHEKLERSHYCVECDVHYKTYKSLKRHLLEAKKHVRLDDLRYKCMHCSNVFSSEKKLKSHTDVKHLKFSSYKCHICEKIYSNNANLRKHLRNIHEVS